MHAVIIAGGLGTRAHAMTGDRIPKALLPVAGIPIVFRQMRVLRREGVTRLTVLAGHHGEQLHAAMADEATALGLALDILVEAQPLGTAGCLTALGPVEDDTLILYGDMLFDVALAPLRDFHRAHNTLITIVAHPNDHPRTSDLLVAQEGLVTSILPHSVPRDGDYRNLVPAGLYLASPEFFRRLPSGKVDMIRDVLPLLIAAGARVGAYDTPEYMRDVGSPARHAAAERDLAAGLPEALNNRHKRPAIFFDVDGVLNEEPGTLGVLRPDQVVLVEGAGAAVRRTREAGMLAVGVTNRPQVARGDITFDDLDRIFARLEALLATDGGVLDRIYFCPHHPDAGFPGEVKELKFRCECRKPGDLMLRWAVADLPVDLKRSALIGDSLRDIGAARAIGVYAYGVRTGYGCLDIVRYPGGPPTAPVPDLMFADVGEAVDFCRGYGAIAAPIVQALPTRRTEGPIIVAVCGRSRAGKSVVAHALARTLADSGANFLHVHLDNWIVPAAERGPNDTAEIRNRVDLLPDLIASLRAGRAITAPGYDSARRVAGKTTTYDAAGRDIVILEGVFAAHASVRAMVDLAVFVEAPENVQRARFDALYRWKSFSDAATEELWDARSSEEWPAVDAQRASADLILSPTESTP
ncbi:MAG: histidinol-phosphate phosphatase family protein [Xanthobacteraceae bacterium]|nr:histidinol-phosphate phosphatase family protein [Xanthobacteraceae bacterium]